MGTADCADVTSTSIPELMRNVHIYPSEFRHESRILKEAATLAKLGFAEIDLVGVKGAGLLDVESVAPKISIRRLGPAKGRGVMKAVRHVLWCISVLWLCLSRRYSVVNCHSLPVLPIGVLACLLTGATLVYDTHELETETAGSSARRRRLGRLLERACIRFASLVIVVSPAIERWYRQQYGIANVVTVLNAPGYSEVATGQHVLVDGDTDKKVVLYQGALAPGRGLEYLIDASPMLEEAGYRLVLMGYGPLEAELKERTKSLPFILHPAVSPSVLLEYTASADIGICLIEDICLSYHLSLPNKLFEYVMARLPVVASNLPEISAVITRNEIGLCLTGWKPMEIVGAIRRVDAMRGDALKARLDAVAKEFCWERQEAVLLDGYQRHLFVG